jgi:hypothetical protein
MRYSVAFIVGVFLLSSRYTSAQNAFIQMYHPQYQELTLLLTDSLYIHTETLDGTETSRAIGYRHVENKPVGWREVRGMNTPFSLIRLDQKTESVPEGLAIQQERVDSIRQDTLKTRMLIMGLQPEFPDSVLFDIWKNEAWVPVQKTNHYYQGTNQIARTFDFHWNESAAQWDTISKKEYAYDGQKRLKERKEDAWKSGQWELAHSYRYGYRSGESKPQYLVWQAGEQLIDSTVTWYDAFGVEDSSRVFKWMDHASAWVLDAKRILNGSEAQTALAGNTYTAAGTTNGATTQWIPKERRSFISGEGVFTNEPQEETVQRLNLNTGEWSDTWRRNIFYQPLQDGRIYGKITINEWGKDSTWHETFLAEGWFRLAPDSLHIDPVDSRTDTFTFSYTCGFYNPYVQNQTLTFPASDVTGDYDLKIFGEDGRLVFRQRYDSNGLATVSAPLLPGLYIVSVSRGGIPLCTQKLVVH